MKFGIAVPNFGAFATREQITEIAVLSEELLYDSLWVSDHVIIPASHKVFGDTFLDPLVTLAHIAGSTNKIELGTSVIILPYRNPLVLAKMVSTLDTLSRGRVILGIGAGWLEEEFKALGVPFGERGKITDEYIEIMRELWTSDDPEYSGEYARFSDIKFLPKPERKPHPPVWVGGESRKAMERAARYGDGWHPFGLTPGAFREKAEYLKTLLPPEKKEGFVMSLRRNIEINDKREFGAEETLRGGMEKIAGGIKEYGEAGVDHLILYILGRNFKAILRTLRVFAEEIRPEPG
jgi:probable F420-dependent oxidoreductase